MAVVARSLLAWLALAPLLACGGGRAAPTSTPGGPAAPAAVERFLQLAAERNYVQMGWVFGTSDGPVLEQWPQPEVEKRMYALASVLQHESMVLGRENPVPGRIGGAVRYDVTLTDQGRVFSVPVVVVRGPGGRWYVEQVDLTSVTNVR